mmetsp:Transcript_57528/g.168983  ORF Transcript_57528/g.168983 Transcript_57528/m.168983 type:complete len:443 (+) Transcript_57528:3-1331(+)
MLLPARARMPGRRGLGPRVGHASPSHGPAPTCGSRTGAPQSGPAQALQEPRSPQGPRAPGSGRRRRPRDPSALGASGRRALISPGLTSLPALGPEDLLDPRMTLLAELDGESEPIACLGAAGQEGGVDVGVAAVAVLQLLAEDEAEAVLGAHGLQAPCELLADRDRRGGGGGGLRRRGRRGGRGHAHAHAHGPCRGHRRRVALRLRLRLHLLLHHVLRLGAGRIAVGHHVRRLHAVHLHVREPVGHLRRGRGVGRRRHLNAGRLLLALALASSLALALAVDALHASSRQGPLRLLGLPLLPVREHDDELLAVEDLVVRPRDRLLRLLHRREGHEAESAAVAILVRLDLHGLHNAVGLKVRSDLRRDDPLREVPHAQLDSRVLLPGGAGLALLALALAALSLTVALAGALLALPLLLPLGLLLGLLLGAGLASLLASSGALSL